MSRTPRWNLGQWREQYAQCDHNTNQLAQVILRTLAGYRQNAVDRMGDYHHLAAALNFLSLESFGAGRRYERQLTASAKKDEANAPP